MHSRAPSPAFFWNLTIGRCIGIPLPHDGFQDSDIQTTLSEAETAFARKLSGVRKTTWVGGRMALRALMPEGVSHDFLSNEHNAPIFPPGWTGSVSHKKHLAVAWVAEQEDSWQLGVDLEALEAPRIDIAPRVLTTQELHDFHLCPETMRLWNLMIRFSAKEAVYKAIHPFVKRYVGFQEVEIHMGADDTLTAQLALSEGRFESELFIHTFKDFVVTFARIRRQEA